MDIKSLSVNGKEYQILKLLGKGKGGYSYLACDGNRKVVLKQIHHEPCSYYQFGNKIEAEINDYKRLSKIGIPMPVMIDTDIKEERIVKEFIDGKTAYEMVLDNELPDYCIAQVEKMCGTVRGKICYSRHLGYHIGQCAAPAGTCLAVRMCHSSYAS